MHQRRATQERKIGHLAVLHAVAASGLDRRYIRNYVILIYHINRLNEGGTT